MYHTHTHTLTRRQYHDINIQKMHISECGPTQHTLCICAIVTFSFDWIKPIPWMYGHTYSSIHFQRAWQKPKTHPVWIPTMDRWPYHHGHTPILLMINPVSHNLFFSAIELWMVTSHYNPDWWFKTHLFRLFLMVTHLFAVLDGQITVWSSMIIRYPNISEISLLNHTTFLFNRFNPWFIMDFPPWSSHFNTF